MMDYFTMWRDANHINRTWGEVEYLYPNLTGKFTMGKGPKIGVIINAPKVKDGPVALKYGHMQWGFKKDAKERTEWHAVGEYKCTTGEELQPFFKTRRCLIPVDRWCYEYTTLGRKVEKTFCAVESQPMAFAGIYNYFDLPDGRRQGTVAILSIAATEFYEEVKERSMPAIFLPGPEAIQWLNPELKESKAWELVRAFPMDRMKIDGAETA